MNRIIMPRRIISRDKVFNLPTTGQWRSLIAVGQVGREEGQAGRGKRKGGEGKGRRGQRGGCRPTALLSAALLLAAKVGRSWSARVVGRRSSRGEWEKEEGGRGRRRGRLARRLLTALLPAEGCCRRRGSSGGWGASIK